MTLSVKRGSLWRRELANRPGSLADVLEHLTKAGVNLQIITSYCYESREGAAIEIFPIADLKAEEAAKAAGFTKAQSTCCLTITSKDHVGVIFELAKTISDAGINLQFIQSQSIGDRYTALLGFFSEDDIDRTLVVLGQKYQHLSFGAD